MPCSAMKPRNVSWEDGDEKRGPLPGVTHSSAEVQIACLNLVSRHPPTVGQTVLGGQTLHPPSCRPAPSGPTGEALESQPNTGARI